jgi:threonine dehydrogenase-like Zn-dependent dehydrogenase
VRAVRCHQGTIRVEEVPAPLSKDGDGIRVRVRSAGICGSDLHMIDAGFPMLRTPGHEIAGELADGTGVAIEPIVACGECEECARGRYNLCPTQLQAFIGIGRDGGMAEELVVPERCLVRLAPGVPVADACLVEPLAVAIHGLRKLSFDGSQRVAVIGGGTIGLCALAAALERGAEVGLRARHDVQLAAGSRLGAREVAGSYDVVIDCAGTAGALEEACRICRPGGTLLLLASYWDGFEPPGMLLCMKEIAVVPSFMYARADEGRDVDAAAALLRARPEIAAALITHRLPLEAAAEAFALARDRKRAIKVVLSP